MPTNPPRRRSKGPDPVFLARVALHSGLAEAEKIMNETSAKLAALIELLEHDNQRGALQLARTMRADVGAGGQRLRDRCERYPAKPAHGTAPIVSGKPGMPASPRRRGEKGVQSFSAE